MDALRFLKADHAAVAKLLQEFESADEAARARIVAKICRELTIHATIEEEIFYPAAREAVGSGEGATDNLEMLNEAAVEHDALKYLIELIRGAESDSELFAARVTVLGEYVRHHVKEEERKLFPQLKRTGIDFRTLGAELERRKSLLSTDGHENLVNNDLDAGARARGEDGGVSDYLRQ